MTDKRKPKIRIERATGGGWGTSDKGSGQTNEGCAVLLFIVLALPALVTLALTLRA